MVAFTSYREEKTEPRSLEAALTSVQRVSLTTLPNLCLTIVACSMGGQKNYDDVKGASGLGMRH